MDDDDDDEAAPLNRSEPDGASSDMLDAGTGMGSTVASATEAMMSVWPLPSGVMAGNPSEVVPLIIDSCCPGEKGSRSEALIRQELATTLALIVQQRSV